ASGRIDLARAGRAHAGAQHIDADHKIAIGVDRLAGSDHRLPPPRLAGDGVGFGNELIPGQGVADEDGIGALSVEFAVSLISDGERPELGAGIKCEGLLASKLDAMARKGSGVNKPVHSLRWRAHGIEGNVQTLPFTPVSREGSNRPVTNGA